MDEQKDVENLIMETFAAHEYVAPEGDAVLAATRQRIERRAVLSRPLAVAAGVAVVTLAAVAAVALNRTPADNTRAAGPTNQVQAADPTTESNKAAVGDLLMPFSVDWLPPGKADYLARRINIGAAANDPNTPLYDGEYLLTVTHNGQVLEVEVQQMRMMTPEDAAFKSGAGQPITINGQHGVESAHPDGPGGYELYLAQPDGGSMYVNVAAHPGSTASVQQLVDNGRRIAEHVRVPGTTTVTPAFGLRDLPSELRVCAFDVEQGAGEAPRASGGSAPSTHYSLGTCATMPPVNVNTRSPDVPAGTPGQPVQGHKTSYINENGYYTLFVLDAVDGDPIAIAGEVPLTDLYGVGDHLVLPR